MQAARKLKGRPRQQKMRLTVEIVQACVATLVRDDSEVWELVLALYIVLMFVTFNRWVDMTALRIDGMLNRDGWIGLFVGLSKTDQVFKGRWQAIGRTGKFTCPVALLRRVLRETGWKSGFLFRRCLRRGATRTNEKGARRFQPRWGRSETQCKKGDYNVYRDLFLNVLVRVGGGAWTKKQAAECWGLHSGRVGGASFAAKCGVPGWMRRKMEDGRVVRRVGARGGPLRAAAGGARVGDKQVWFVSGGGRTAEEPGRVGVRMRKASGATTP